MKVLHIITGLTQGGAESALFRLTTYEKESSLIHIVVSMVDLGVYGDQFKEAGIETHMLGMPRGRLTLKGVSRLWTLLKEIKPDIVQTWMYHADLVGGLLARFAGYPNVIWGIVHFNLDKGVAGRSTRWTATLCAWMSYLVPKKIISCSESATQVHKKIGYAPAKFLTIPLGYDLGDLKRNELSRHKLRAAWGIDNGTVVFGCLARWNPQKDHFNLLKAFAIVNRQFPDACCILAGREIDKSNPELNELIAATNKGNNKLVLFGVVDNIASFMNAVDIHVLSSLGEAFPNVVAEAMACETACVVTDVGDAAQIVGETGWVVPPANSEALAGAMTNAVKAMTDEKVWEQRKKQCRARIVENYSMDRMIYAYRKTWTSLLKKTNE